MGVRGNGQGPGQQRLERLQVLPFHGHRFGESHQRRSSEQPLPAIHASTSRAKNAGSLRLPVLTFGHLAI